MTKLAEVWRTKTVTVPSLIAAFATTAATSSDISYVPFPLVFTANTSE
jgi:hypothetical protein